MSRPVKTASDNEQSASIQKRCIEILFFLVSAALIVTTTLSFLIRKHFASEDLYCGENATQHMVRVNGTIDFFTGVLKSLDGMNYNPGQFWTADDEYGTVWGCPCLAKPCVHKCCFPGDAFYSVSFVFNGTAYPMLSCMEHSRDFKASQRNVHHSEKRFNHRVSVDDDHFFAIPGVIPCAEYYHVTGEENENAFLLKDGRLYMKDSVVPLRSRNDYCLESLNGTSEVQILMCLSEDAPVAEESWKEVVRLVGFSISLPCLLATLLTYLVLPQLRNLHGRALACHVTSLAVAYSGLIITYLERYLPAQVCTTVGYVILFSTLASFFWLNVMCFDIWWVFSGLMPQGGHKQAEQVRFRLYCGYAWGCPLAMTTLALAVDHLSTTTLRPAIGVYDCFITGRDPRLLYLYLPVGMVVYLNTAMFITTALRFKKHSRCVKRLQRGNSRRHCRAGQSLTDVQRFSLYVKLSVVMGLNWALEVADFLLSSGHPLWLAADLANALQGLPLLYMFVCRPRVLAMLNQRLCPSLRLATTERTARTVTSSVKSNASSSRKGSDVGCQLTALNADLAANE